MPRALATNGLDPKGRLDSNVRRILATRIAELYGWTPAVQHPETGDELHALRISIKRLRYILEIFDDVFGTPGDRAVVRVKQLQQELGDLHDIDVRIELIQTEIDAVTAEQTRSLSADLAEAPPSQHSAMVSSAMRPPPDDPRRGLMALLARQHAARQTRLSSFRDVWTRLHEEGLRRDLVALSAPLTELPEDERDRVRAALTKRRSSARRKKAGS